MHGILEIILCGIKVYILRCIFFELNILEDNNQFSVCTLMWPFYQVFISIMDFVFEF